MPILRITVTENGAGLHGSSAPLLPALARALAEDDGPVTVMVHGYRYAPGTGLSCPHETLFHRAPEGMGARIISWPRHLGLRGQRGEGLGISFGWPARGSLWDAHRRAETAGLALSGLLDSLRDLDPGRTVNLICHSLGARVALAAIRAGRPGAINRAVLLAAAEFAGTAQKALRSVSGRHTQVLNVTTRENDLFDFLFQRLVAPETRGDRMLGQGQGPAALPNMVTLQLDDAASLQALRAAGYRIAARERLICHWSPYLRAGVFPLYGAFLSGGLGLPELRATLPEAPAPRWSRLRRGLTMPPIATRAIGHRHGTGSR
ncbi:alpha/beta hydrolase [Sagittula salina]|uniref:Alpha/beta hydrolase n=1 Tax=Sagittula salina TaxID=2820268 RepID=A0A940S1I4_9RHOB|nr:alpha/beta hydrolase [Sagittula salina]MBP0484188.1 alpha/beta hydrolase [Sagittula salina]